MSDAVDKKGQIIGVFHRNLHPRIAASASSPTIIIDDDNDNDGRPRRTEILN